MVKRKDPAAVAMGKKGGKASAKSMSPKERSDRAKKAIKARWDKYRAEKKESKP